MSDRPLVSIGIPTFNRPEGLRRTLEHVLKQNYKNIEVVISNNASSNLLVDSIVVDFLSRDNRIKYFRQTINRGPVFNFKFVFEKATGDYFMWAADDDYFESADLIEKLVERCADTILAFPEVHLFNADMLVLNVLKPFYEKCRSKHDYLDAWSKSGAGYPIYGLYNLSRLKESGVEFEFEGTLLYYTEGIFLHKLFINGGALFVPEVSMRIDNSSSRPASLKLGKYFNTYCNKTLQLYLSSKVENKIRILGNIFKIYRDHYYFLMSKIKTEKGIKRAFLFLLNKPIFWAFSLSIVTIKVIPKIKSFF